MRILLILRYQHITTKIKQYLTCKHDILQTCNCKDGHIKMTTIIKIGFTVATQLAYSVYYGDQWSARKFNTAAI